MKKKILGVVICTIATLMVIGACAKKENTTDVETTIADTTVDAQGSESGTTETGSYGYVNEGKGDNYANDIFTDAAVENNDVDDDDDNEINNKKPTQNTGSNSSSEDASQSETTDNEKESTESSENINTDDGWTPFY